MSMRYPQELHHQPYRLSSEAPEVVNDTPERFATRTSATGHKQQHLPYQPGGTGEGVFEQQPKDVDGNSSRYPNTPVTPFTPGFTPGPSIYEAPSERERIIRQRRTVGLVTAILLVVIAFLIGGGIGSGIGVAVTDKRISSASSATVTVTAPAAVASNVILDLAGCPLINNKTYTSTSKAIDFVQLCSIDIQPATSGPGIDFGNSTQTTFGACLDACAGTTGCVAASWVTFSPTYPVRNNVCFYKNGTGSQTQASVSGQQVASGILKSLITSS